jgi:hypothetical protein
VEGYFCKYQKAQGFSCKKLREQAGLTGIDPGRLDLDPLDLDLTAQDACVWLRGGG